MANNLHTVNALIDEAFAEAVRPNSHRSVYLTLAGQAMKSALYADQDGSKSATTLDTEDAMEIFESLRAIPDLMLEARGEEALEDAVAFEWYVDQLGQARLAVDVKSQLNFG